MSDTQIYLTINGWSGQIPFFDGFFRGISNDYFALITMCLVMIWLWFGTRDPLQRENNQKAVITAIVSIAIVSGLVGLCNSYYFRPRPFDVLPPGSYNIVFYRPHDSSFPANFTAVIFALATCIFFKNKKVGGKLLAFAALTSFGRIYMGIHYPLDILGGIGFGVIAALLAYLITRVAAPLVNLLINALRKIYIA